jgi:hypothetical protein
MMVKAPTRTTSLFSTSRIAARYGAFESEIEVALRYVDAGNRNLDRVAESKCRTRVLFDHHPLVRFDIPPPFEGVARNESLDEETRRLNEESEARHSSDHTCEALANSFGEVLEEEHLAELPLGSLSSSFRLRAMLCELVEFRLVVTCGIASRSALAGPEEILSNHPMNDEVRVTANRAGEVTIGPTRECEVPLFFY